MDGIQVEAGTGLAAALLRLEAEALENHLFLAVLSFLSTCDIRCRMCFGVGSLMPLKTLSSSASSRQSAHCSRSWSELRLREAMRTRRWAGLPRGLVGVLWPPWVAPEEPLFLGSKGLTYMVLMPPRLTKGIEPLGAITPLEASSSRPAREP